MLADEILNDFSVFSLMVDLVVSHLNRKLKQAFLHRLHIRVAQFIVVQDKRLIPLAL